MIEIRHLYKGFKEEFIFEDFNISFFDKKITSIVGPSGCGKTTLLRIIAGLEPYNRGTVTGIDQRSLAFVFQEDRLLPWLSVTQNIEIVMKTKFNGDEIKHRVREVLSLLDITAAAQMMPDELSGGMQRRVAIGRALAYDGEIILLDEPFKGMDDKLRRGILEQLGSIWRASKKTVILVTHDIEDAKKISDTVYELSGRPLKKSILY